MNFRCDSHDWNTAVCQLASPRNLFECLACECVLVASIATNWVDFVESSSLLEAQYEETANAESVDISMSDINAVGTSYMCLVNVSSILFAVRTQSMLLMPMRLA